MNQNDEIALSKMLSEKTTAGTLHESTSPSIPAGGNFEKIIDVSISDPNQTTVITDENVVGTANSIVDGRSSSSQNVMENDSKLVDQNFTAQIKKKEVDEKINREQLKLTKQNSKLEE